MFKVVLVHIYITGACGVTIQTGDISVGVSAGRPVCNDAPAFLSVAIDAFFGIFRNTPVAETAHLPR
jgi:hypothetical protein